MSCIGSSTNLSKCDCKAWQTLYSFTGGNNWAYCTDSFNDPCSCKSPVGVIDKENKMIQNNVICRTDSENIKYIDGIILENNNLVGNIPPEIKNFKNMSQLYLSNNNGLIGNIPAEIGTMTKLEVLDLSSNNLTGYIPSTLNNLTNLRSLNLNNNKLRGDIPNVIGDMDNLIEYKRKWIINL